MENLANSIASSGELAAASSDMKILLYVFLFGFICITITGILVAISNLGK